MNTSQSINSILYSASLYTRSRFTESRVQLSFIHSHTGGGKLHQSPQLPWGRLTEAWLPISAYGPSDHHQHSFIFIRCNANYKLLQIISYRLSHYRYRCSSTFLWT